MEPGDVIAQRYRLDRLLGEGGMGAVWAATHTVTRKPVALKLIRPHGDAEKSRRRVFREARAACAVAHPAVVSVHDVVEAGDGSPVLVMDLLDGEPLRARLDRERALPEAEARRVVETMLDALEVAHAAGIVHRDLKPENLFLLRDGRIMLLDFGVAKLVAAEGPAAHSGTLTAEGAMVGTPFYMAPEQAFGEAVDARADLWAVGIVLYECLAGEPPTKADNLGQVLKMLSTGKLTPLRDRVPAAPEAMLALSEALLAIDPAERPASAKAARAILGGQAPPSTARREPSTIARSAPPPRDESASRAGPSRARRALAITAVGGTLAGVAIAFALRGAMRPSARPAPAAATAVASAMEAPSTEPAVTAAPEVSAGASAVKPPAPAPRPVRSAKPAPMPSAAPSSSAPRLLTDVPF